MRAIIVLLCILSLVFADRWYESYVVRTSREDPLPGIGSQIRNTIDTMYSQVRSFFTRNPEGENPSGIAGWTVGNLVSLGSGREVHVEFEWVPGQAVGLFANGLRPPVAPTGDDMDYILQQVHSTLFSGSSVRTEMVLKLKDSCQRGGHLTVQVTDFGQDLKKRNGVSAKRQSTRKITMIPFGDGRNGTFIDMTKVPNIKRPPPRFTLNTTMHGGHSNGPICPRGDIGYNPMSVCSARDTLIAGKSIWSDHNPQDLVSPLGNYAHFFDSGALCMSVVAGGVERYACHGYNGKHPGPYQAHLETNGALCLYDKNGACYSCTAGSTNDGQYRMVMQDDGNLVIYRGRDNKQAIWASKTNWYPQAFAHRSPFDCNIPKP